MRRIHLGLALVALLVAITGCGGSGRIVVEGTVTLNGEPLQSGAISLIPISGQGVAAGTEISNGVYRIQAQGLLPGEYKVMINAFRGTGKKTWDGMGDSNAPASQKRYVEEMEQYIPAKYNDSTELKATVAAGKTSGLNFDLQAPAAHRPK
jgi:hypothetical protein